MVIWADLTNVFGGLGTLYESRCPGQDVGPLLAGSRVPPLTPQDGAGRSRPLQDHRQEAGLEGPAVHMAQLLG